MIALAIVMCALGILTFAWLFPYKTLTMAILYALCLCGLAFLGVCVLFIGGLIAVVSGGSCALGMMSVWSGPLCAKVRR